MINRTRAVHNAIVQHSSAAARQPDAYTAERPVELLAPGVLSRPASRMRSPRPWPEFQGTYLCPSPTSLSSLRSFVRVRVADWSFPTTLKYSARRRWLLLEDVSLRPNSSSLMAQGLLTCIFSRCVCVYNHCVQTYISCTYAVLVLVSSTGPAKAQQERYDICAIS